MTICYIRSSKFTKYIFNRDICIGLTMRNTVAQVRRCRSSALPMLQVLHDSTDDQWPLMVDTNLKFAFPAKPHMQKTHMTVCYIHMQVTIITCPQMFFT